MPDGTNMTPENSYNQFKIGEPAELPESKKPDIDQFKIGPDEGHQMRIGAEIKNLLDDEDDRNKDLEAMYANYSIDEERSRMDPEFQRMINAESPKDIAPMLDSLRREMDTDLMDAIDKYGNTRALSAAWKRSMVLEKGHDYLTSPDHLIVVKRNNRRLPGTINEDGSIGEDSVPRVGGYSLYVDVRKVEVPDIRTSPSKNGPVEYTVMVPTRKEEVNYGTEQMRKILSKTYLEFVKQGVVAEQVFNHANLLWNFRAALEGMVKTIYTKEIYKSNFSIQSFFSAPDIGEMENNPENKKVGEQRDKATRLLELVGYCETKEKFEEHLNGTFNLESILDDDTQNRVLGFMKESGVITESQLKTLKEQGIDSTKPSEVNDKYKKVVKFLLGKNIEITKDTRGVMQYNLEGWLTAEQRDPSKTTDKEEKKKRGKKAIKEEQDVRGWLTKFGNPYVGHVPYDRDNLTALLARMSVIVGNSQSTSEAFRNFYWWGEPDWLGAEIYAKDALPDGATLAKKRSELRGQAWLDYAGEVRSYFTTGGEPNGTDLVKIMWPDLYRLKDFVAGQGRPTGQYVTVMQGMDHLAQSLFGLVRSEVNVNGTSKMRNLREQWLGSKDETLGIEKPHNLGDIEWTRVGGPTEVLTELLTNKIGGIDWKDVELTDSTKKMIESYQKGGDRAGLVKIVNDLVDSKTEAIGAGAEGFYWLMNFLVGDENEIKRMWAALNTELKPDTLTVTNGFTGKIKFMDITQEVQGSYDGYIAAEKRAKLNNRSLDDQVETEGKKRAKDYLRIWYKGVKGDPQYRTWAMKSIDRLKVGSNSTEPTTYGEYIDSLAVMYDFMDKDEARKPLNNFPKLQVDIV